MVSVETRPEALQYISDENHNKKTGADCNVASDVCLNKGKDAMAETV